MLINHYRYCFLTQKVGASLCFLSLRFLSGHFCRNEFSHWTVFLISITVQRKKWLDNGSSLHASSQADREEYPVCEFDYWVSGAKGNKDKVNLYQSATHTASDAIKPTTIN